MMILLHWLFISFVQGFLNRPPWPKQRSGSLWEPLPAKRIPRSSKTRPPSRRPQRRGRPRQEQRQEETIRRAPHQFDHTKDNPRPFIDNPVEYVAAQQVNHDSSIFEWLRYDDVVVENREQICEIPHVRCISLDDLFPGIGFSAMFATSNEFRSSLRQAIREDVFDQFYTHIANPKARAMLLLPDSSLQGGWKLNAMLRTDVILRQHLGTGAPTGKALMETIGGLCGGGNETTSHWMDIVGVPNRKIPYSWHQDRNDGNTHHSTVLWGFPKENSYRGTGVFSHVVKLRHPVKSSKENIPQQPLVYHDLQVDEEFIHRPSYDTNAELIVYQDANVLHSAPDVTYRASLMRFMV